MLTNNNNISPVIIFSTLLSFIIDYYLVISKKKCLLEYLTMKQWSIIRLLGNNIVMVLSFLIVKKVFLTLKVFYPVSCLLSVVFYVRRGEFILSFMARNLYLMNDNKWCIVWSSKYEALLLNRTFSHVEHNNVCEHTRHAL